MSSEPVINTALVTALVTAILGALVAFNVPITQEQRNAIIALTGTIMAIIVGSGVFARNFVTSQDTLDEKYVKKPGA